jgi:hypothetical protein
MFRSPHAFVMTARCFLLLLTCSVYIFTISAPRLTLELECMLFGGAAFLGFMLAILAFPWNRKEDVSRGVALVVGAGAVLRTGLAGDLANRMRALSRRFGNVPFDVIEIELAREERRSRKLVIAAHERKRANRSAEDRRTSTSGALKAERAEL